MWEGCCGVGQVQSPNSQRPPDSSYPNIRVVSLLLLTHLSYDLRKRETPNISVPSHTIVPLYPEKTKPTVVCQTSTLPTPKIVGTQ